MKMHCCLLLAVAACHSAAPAPHTTSLCSSSAACGAGQLCTAGYCVPQLCGASADCGPALSCQAGACALPPGPVASCELAPAQQLLRDGEQGTPLTVLARDASGAVLPEPRATFAAQGAIRLGAAGVPIGAGAGAGTIEAHLGTVTCAAQTKSFGAPAPGTLRALVIDQSTGQPLSGAVVGLDDLSTSAITDATGVAVLPLSAPGAHDVHVLHAGFDFTSFLGATSTDLLVPLQPAAFVMRRGRLTGRLTAQDFATLPRAGAGVQAALFGASQPGGPFDLSLDNLFAWPSAAQISIGGFSQLLTVSGSMVLGTASGFVNDGKFGLLADPGPRVVWGFGGNLDAAAVAQAMAPVYAQGSSTDDVALGLTRLLTLLEGTKAGAQVGLDVVASGGWPGQVNVDTPVSVALAVPRELAVSVELPDLPADGASYLPMGLAGAGAVMGSLGFAPLGLTAGVAARAGGARTAKLVDPHCDPVSPAPGCIGNWLPLLLAPESGGLEGSPVLFAAVALDPASVLPGTYAGPGTQLGPSRIAASVLFQAAPAIHPGDVVRFAGPFMPLPAPGAFQLVRASRTLTVRAGAGLSRFEVENKFGHVWRIWIPEGARTVTLPQPPEYDGERAAIYDPLQDAGDVYLRPPGPPVARVFAVQYAGAPAWADLTSFGARSLAVRANVRGWAVSSVPIQ